MSRRLLNAFGRLGEKAMGFYRSVILPKLCDLCMRSRRLRPFRERVVGAAEGRVLEIGAGSGLNLKFYKPSVSEVLALEPDPNLLRNLPEQQVPLVPPQWFATDVHG